MFDYIAVPANALIVALAALLHTPVAVTIVLTTVAVRLLLLPLGIDQHRAGQRAEKLRAALADRVDKLKKRFRHHPERLEQEISALYRAEAPGLARGTARGCLPALLQAPVFMALYAAFTVPTGASLFGVPLEMHLVSAAGPQLVVFAAVLALAAATGFASSRVAAAGRPQPTRWLKLIHYTPMLSIAFIPLAASIYLVTSMSWTVLQTLVLRQVLG
jgi:YidC/Oxa1 family membrane protein insertase